MSLLERKILLALVAGVLFGAGLAVSGMVDPTRVRAFLDVTGAWDPTLAFVMAGALLPMTVAWRLTARRRTPLVARRFHLPATTPIDAPLVLGGVLFGLGWGLAGFCPGPALAALALAPGPALLFVLAMGLGMALHWLVTAPPVRHLLFSEKPS